MWAWKIFLFYYVTDFWDFFLESNLDLIAVNAEFSAKFHSFSLRHIEATSFLAKCEWISPSNSICRWRYNSNRFNLLSSLKMNLKIDNGIHTYGKVWPSNPNHRIGVRVVVRVGVRVGVRIEFTVNTRRTYFSEKNKILVGPRYGAFLFFQVIILFEWK